MKPKHLAKEYGDQFQDQSIVDRYRKRPAYASSVIDALVESLNSSAHIVDVGCGTGEIAIPLAERGFQVTGIDPSPAMITRAASLSDQVTWRCAYAENVELPENVDLIVTANSLHWMDWPIVFTKFAQALQATPNKSHAATGQLAIITGGDLKGFAGEAELLTLVGQYSTNQDFKPFSLVELITEARHFQLNKTVVTTPQPYQQTIVDFIASIHARNGFSLERMGQQQATEFDEKVKAVLERHDAQWVSGFVQSTIAFGYPLAG